MPPAPTIRTFAACAQSEHRHQPDGPNQAPKSQKQEGGEIRAAEIPTSAPGGGSTGAGRGGGRGLAVGPTLTASSEEAGAAAEAMGEGAPAEARVLRRRGFGLGGKGIWGREIWEEGSGDGGREGGFDEVRGGSRRVVPHPEGGREGSVVEIEGSVAVLLLVVSCAAWLQPCRTTGRLDWMDGYATICGRAGGGPCWEPFGSCRLTLGF